MRILHILDHSVPLHSGYAFRTEAILRHQRALGWETFHLTSPKHVLSGPARETVGELEFFRTPPAWRGWSRVPGLGEAALMAALARRLEAVVQEVAPDILHVHSPVLNALSTLWVASRRHLPVLYEVRASWEDAAVSHGTARQAGLRYVLSRALETFAVRRADAVTTICEGLRGDLIGRGLSQEAVTVIPNAVDLAQFEGAAAQSAASAELAERLGLAGKIVLGFIGSFYRYEGLHLLIEAMPRLLAQSPDVRVLLVGGGPEEARLKALADRLSLGGAVIFTGRVPHEAVPAYYDLAHVMVYPRLSIRLTEIVTPLKPLEAMAQHKLVVASNVGGHRELIREGETGYLFQPDDAADLAETVLRVLEARPSWPTLLQRARHFVETERTWTKSVARYAEVYARLLGPGAARAVSRCKTQVAR